MLNHALEVAVHPAPAAADVAGGAEEVERAPAVGRGRASLLVIFSFIRQSRAGDTPLFLGDFVRPLVERGAVPPVSWAVMAPVTIFD